MSSCLFDLSSLHNLYLLLRQSIQLIHKLIYLFVHRIDLALEGGLLMLGFGEASCLWSVSICSTISTIRSWRDFVGWIGEVDCTDWESLEDIHQRSVDMLSRHFLSPHKLVEIELAKLWNLESPSR